MKTKIKNLVSHLSVETLTAVASGNWDSIYTVAVALYGVSGAETPCEREEAREIAESRAKYLLAQFSRFPTGSMVMSGKYGPFQVARVEDFGPCVMVGVYDEPESGKLEWLHIDEVQLAAK